MTTQYVPQKYDRIYQESRIAYMQKRMSNNVLLLIFRIYVLVPILIYWGLPAPKPPWGRWEGSEYALKKRYLIALVKITLVDRNYLDFVLVLLILLNLRRRYL